MMNDPGARDLDPFPRAHLADVLEEGAVEQRGVEVDVLVERLGIELLGDARVGEERLDLAHKENPRAIVVIIKLLHTKQIACKKKTSKAQIKVHEHKNPHKINEYPGTACLKKY